MVNTQLFFGKTQYTLKPISLKNFFSYFSPVVTSVFGSSPFPRRMIFAYDVFGNIEILTFPTTKNIPFRLALRPVNDFFTKVARHFYLAFHTFKRAMKFLGFRVFIPCHNYPEWFLALLAINYNFISAKMTTALPRTKMVCYFSDLILMFFYIFSAVITRRSKASSLSVVPMSISSFRYFAIAFLVSWNGLSASTIAQLCHSITNKNPFDD